MDVVKSLCFAILATVLASFAWAQPSQIMSPNYLGPNALPVPEVKSGGIANDIRLELSSLYQNSDATSTTSLYSHILVPFNQHVAVELYMVPFETFNYHQAAPADMRVDSSKAGWGIGDLYLGATSLLWQNGLDVTGSFYVKTASGENVGQARFTDTPAYWLDVTLGQNWQNWRWSVSQGFYVWQTYDYPTPQNDAYLYGVALAHQNGVKFELTGYHGWKENGDSPLVARARYEGRYQDWAWLIKVEQGLKDFPFTTVGLGFAYYLPRI